MTSPPASLDLTCARYWVIRHGYGGRLDDFEREPAVGGSAFIKLDARTLFRLATRIQASCGLECAPVDARAIELFQRSGGYHYTLRELAPDAMDLAPLFRTLVHGEPLEKAAAHYDLPPDETMADALAELSPMTLVRLRNAVYAHHGRPFAQPDLHAFFYGEVPSFVRAHARTDAEQRTAAGLPRTPDPAFDESMLTSIDHANIAQIRSIERAPRPEPD